ncbi:MAG: hypothetical protein O2913_13710 [Chloroflexi bacterium]|nr:hypothetical protein [Chloroflexota bacterium]
MGEDKTNNVEAEDRGFIPARDALIGETEADNYRHVLVRQEFFKEFWGDEKVQALVSHWAKITGLEKLAQNLASSGDRLAELAGFESRGELIGRDELTFEDDRAEQGKKAMAEVEAAHDAFLLQLSKPAHSADVGQQAVDFVESFDLPYPWLAIELVESFFNSVGGFALGRIVQVDGWYEPKPLSELIAPKATMSFQSKEGESVEDAVNRVSGYYEEVVTKLLEPRRPLGKIPDRTIPLLERDARWLYRHNVKGESIRSIANQEFPSSDRRKDIYDGIRRAKQLLELTQYTY